MPSTTTPLRNGPLSFTITASNAGPGSANNSVLKDPAIPGYTATGVTCSAAGGAICPAGTSAQLLAALQDPAGLLLPTLPVGGQLTFVLSGTFTLPSGSLTNVATLFPPVGVPTSAVVATALVALPVGVIPTLGEYTLMALMLLLMVAGGIGARRAQRPVT
ncbi:MAG: hypothetical protein IPO58_03235 [Betaproteobacteria bacterium]|nr:hypothetical protein [Betaproteobacteria bacterium]